MNIRFGQGIAEVRVEECKWLEPGDMRWHPTKRDVLYVGSMRLLQEKIKELNGRRRIQTD